MRRGKHREGDSEPQLLACEQLEMSSELTAQRSGLTSLELGLAVNLAIPERRVASTNGLPTLCPGVRYLVSAYLCVTAFLFVSYHPLTARRLDAGDG